MKIETLLHRIDRSKIAVRDLIILHHVIQHPGRNGIDIYQDLGLRSRSLVQYCLKRLENRGFIEGRSDQRRQGHPIRNFATPKGLAFWQEMIR